MIRPKKYMPKLICNINIKITYKTSWKWYKLHPCYVRKR